jgi:hypothetical protein
MFEGFEGFEGFEMFEGFEGFEMFEMFEKFVGFEELEAVMQLVTIYFAPDKNRDRQFGFSQWFCKFEGLNSK